jgi:hypothetical protein
MAWSRGGRSKSKRRFQSKTASMSDGYGNENP